MAHRTDGFRARLPGLGEKADEQRVHRRRVDDLPHRLLVAAGEEDQVEGVEGEGGRGPGEGVLPFFGRGHGVVLLDGGSCGALEFGC